MSNKPAGFPDDTSSETSDDKLLSALQMHVHNAQNGGMQDMFGGEGDVHMQASLNELLELKRQRDHLVEQLRAHESARTGHQEQLARLHQEHQGLVVPTVQRTSGEGEEGASGTRVVTGAANGRQQERRVVAAHFNGHTSQDVIQLDTVIDELDQYSKLGREMVSAVQEGNMTREVGQSADLVKEVIERFDELRTSFNTLKEAISEFQKAGITQGDKYDSILSFRSELLINFEAAKRCFISTSKLLQMAVDKRRDEIAGEGASSPPSRPMKAGNESAGKTINMSGTRSRPGGGAPGSGQQLVASGRSVRSAASGDNRLGGSGDGHTVRNSWTHPVTGKVVSKPSEHDQVGPSSGSMDELALIQRLLESGLSVSEPSEGEQLAQEEAASHAVKQRLGQLRAKREHEESEIRELLEQRNQLAQQLQHIQKARAAASAAADSMAAGGDGVSEMAIAREHALLLKSIQQDLRAEMTQQRSANPNADSTHSPQSPTGRREEQTREAQCSDEEESEDDNQEDEQEEDEDVDDEDNNNIDEDDGEDEENMTNGYTEAETLIGRDSSRRLMSAEEGRSTAWSGSQAFKPLNPELASLERMPELEQRLAEMEDKKRELDRLRSLLGMLRAEEMEGGGGMAHRVGEMMREEAERNEDHARSNGAGKSRDSVTFQEPIATFIANDELYENMREARMWREELRDQQQNPGATPSPSAGPSKNFRGGEGRPLDTVSQDRTTLATWGGSSSAGDLEMGTASSNMSDVMGTAQMQPSTPVHNSMPSPRERNDNLDDSRFAHLQNQVNSIASMCHQMMVELVSKLPATPPAHTSIVPFSPPMDSPPIAPPATASQHHQMEAQMLAAVQSCSARMAQFQMQMWLMMQQMQMLAPPVAPFALPPPTQPLAHWPGYPQASAFNPYSPLGVYPPPQSSPYPGQPQQQHQTPHQSLGGLSYPPGPPPLSSLYTPANPWLTGFNQQPTANQNGEHRPNPTNNLSGLHRQYNGNGGWSTTSPSID